MKAKKLIKSRKLIKSNNGASDILIIYKSKYGSTKEYAEWIASETKADIVPLKEITWDNLEKYKKVVFGTYLHIGTLVGIEEILKKWSYLEKKRFVLFSVSAAKPGNPTIEDAYVKGVPASIRAKTKFFQLRGRMIKLDLIDSIAVSVPKTMLKLKYFFSKDPICLKMIEGFSPFNGMDKKTIAPIVKELKK
jgi:flavodoxin